MAAKKLDFAKLTAYVAEYEPGEKEYDQWQSMALLKPFSGRITATEIEKIPSDFLICAFLNSSEYYREVISENTKVNRMISKMYNLPRVCGKRKLL